jgi:hypothetical protein
LYKGRGADFGVEGGWLKDRKGIVNVLANADIKQTPCMGINYQQLNFFVKLMGSYNIVLAAIVKTASVCISKKRFHETLCASILLADFTTLCLQR